MNKRQFIKTTGATTALTFLNPLEIFSFTEKPKNNNGKKALILGGRGFIGPTIVKSFIDAGYEVTLLNRNKTNTHLFKNLPLVICDREKENKAGLKAIDKKYEDEFWDVVVDTWQKSPKAVSDFLEEFKGKFGHYHYISTISVYDSWDKKFIQEDEPLNPLPKFPTTIQESHRYAIRKTFAEEIIREKLSNYTIYRSSGMKDDRSVNPLDVNEEPFWPIRFYRGGEILVPKVENHHIQITDVESLVNFMVHCSNHETYGEFNVAYRPTPFKDYVSSLIHATGMPEKLHWIDGEFLIQNGFEPYKVVPLWKPKPVGSYYFNVHKATTAGLVNRPMVDMISDEIAGYKKRYPDNDVKFGKISDKKQVKYSLAQEKEMIKKWMGSLQKQGSLR